ncbi:hypothetical protein DZC75_05090 [Pseudomonas parafulva]|uniref:Uncharacterized protein n=1 Tax=Pseudomonas parafulva TaxID=157782 RepID=A0AAI8K9H9_9PSED|nr:hypothetical protein [Pseudomonas parafulva]AIZ31943.1 hypothetical protein NJ69_02370 [Pseudomonas parafulva]AXO87425.1 hypothetical protein DZC75_05090 [Pseudomonas parafulva]
MNSTEQMSPLTIIAIFSGIIEASALASLPFLSESSQSIYTWFLVGFPFFLTVLFFLTLNFNHESLYTPDKRAVDDEEPLYADTQAPMTIALSGPGAHKNIETHVLNALNRPPGRECRWIFYNLECRSRILLSIRALEKGDKIDL